MATQNVIREEHIDFIQNYRFKAGRIGGRRPRESDIINAALKFTKKCLELPDVEDLFINNLKKEMTNSVYLITWIDEEGGRITKIGKARDPINRFRQIKDKYEKKLNNLFSLNKIKIQLIFKEDKNNSYFHDRLIKNEYHSIDLRRGIQEFTELNHEKKRRKQGISISNDLRAIADMKNCREIKINN